MKINFLNLLLIGSIVSLVMLSGCSDDEADNTPPPGNTTPDETGTFTDSRDGHVYNYVTIGNQVWMAENLAYTENDIQHITDDSEWINNSTQNGWCYYDNSDSLGAIYGVLYQWGAAAIACPNGWHLPTVAEWDQLENFLKENGYSCDGDSVGSKIGKSLATDYAWKQWSSEYTIGSSDFPEYRNKSGFSALPGGSRKGSDGSCYQMAFFGRWWSNATSDDTRAYTFSLTYLSSGVINSYVDKSYGHSVRCIRD